VEWTCCWTKERITDAECPYVSADEPDLLSSLEHRFVARCLECPRFSRDLERLTGSGDEASPLLNILVSELFHLKARLTTMVGFLDSRNLEIQFLHEIGEVLQTSLGLDEVLSVALTAITAGKGFGMNRAFLLLADKERRNLRGYLGVGPKNYQEAWEIWAEIGRDDFTLKDMARHFFDTKLTAEKHKFRDILERMTVPMSDQGHILNRSLQERKPILVQNAFNNPEVDPLLARTLDVDTFLILPLISRGRRIGVILADNFITRKPITPQDMRSMETLAIPVAFAIERASLYERLHDDLRKLTLANTKLQEQQELIIRMEKLALLGKITSSIAHSIRNPLMIIGGFARSLLKNISEDDPKKESLETIVREARQLEDALSETLGYADSIFPAMDLWDVNQMVGNVFREVRGKTEDREISFSLDLSPDLPAIYMDYRQTAYCIKKILRGSLDAMSPPGELYMGTRLEDDCIVVEIRDSVAPAAGEEDDEFLPNGGIAMADPFGAELSFCRVILENYCKSFTVEEYEGKGRRYVLQLPLRKEDSNHE